MSCSRFSLFRFRTTNQPSTKSDQRAESLLKHDLSIFHLFECLPCQRHAAWSCEQLESLTVYPLHRSGAADERTDFDSGPTGLENVWGGKIDGKHFGNFVPQVGSGQSVGDMDKLDGFERFQKKVF